MEEVRVFRGPMLLGVDQPRNPAVKWNPGERLVLFLSAKGRKLDPLPPPFGVQEIEAKLSYPKAHGRIHASLKSTNANVKEKRKRLEDVVLMPIAEFPGKVGSAETKEAILFDVVVQRSRRNTA